MKNLIKSTTLLFLFLGMIITVLAADKTDIIRADAKTMSNWQDMRFGMFIHWGPVSLTGKEIGWSRMSETNKEGTRWQDYDQLYKKFNPEKFDAAQWVSLAKKAGMKYIVFTSKHHDGFCMWDTQYTDHSIMSSPFKRDVVKEISEECKKQGLKFGPYHSVADWYQPDYGVSNKAEAGYKLDRPPDFEKYFTYLKNELKELHSKYGPFHVFWFDGEWEKPWTHEYGVALNNFCKELQPDAIVNNRVDKGRNDMEGSMKSLDFAGDYATPEQQVGSFNRDFPWETCMTICQQWSWKPKDKLKSLQECLQTLIQTTGGDGNLLFNVGPMPNGEIEQRQVDRLLEMGKWMDQYGNTIYATRGGPFKPGKWGASTCKENTIFLFVMNWDKDSIILPAIHKKIINYKVLSGGTAKLVEEEKQIRISLQEKDRNAIATVIELEINGKTLDIPPVSVQ